MDDFLKRLKQAKTAGKHDPSGGQQSKVEASGLTTIEEQYIEAEAAGPEDGEFYRFRLSVAASNSRIRDSEARIMAVKVKHHEQNLDMRAKYASKAYRFVWLWSVALIVIIILQGSSAPTLKILFINFNAHNFKLDNNVLIALISGVTVNIVAVFVVVIRNLFPSDSVEEKKEKEKESPSNDDNSAKTDN